jgi:hypothetical protein
VFAFPLLSKELIELAAVKRTYVLRTLFAVGMFAVFYAVFHQQFTSLSRGDLSVLGQGKQLFHQLVSWQLIAIYLFVPALVAPVIPTEAANGNLEILMVTGISPRALLAQKLFSRLICIGTFLLLALPIGAVAYTLGGVTSSTIMAAACSACFGCLQIGCWALWCSARSPTSVDALRMSYFRGALWCWLIPGMLTGWANMMYSSVTGVEMSATAIGMFWSMSRQEYSAVQIILAGIPMLACAAFFFFQANSALLKRASEPTPMSAQTAASYQRSRLVQYYHGLIDKRIAAIARRDESPFQRWRRRLASAESSEVALSDRAWYDLPTDQPVAWREKRRSPLSREHYRAAIWALALLILPVCFLVDVASRGHSGIMLSSLNMILIIGGMGALAISASALVSSERSSNSLDLLLISPLSTADIIEQKLAHSRPFMLLALNLIAILAVLEALAKSKWQSVPYVPISIACGYIYLQIGLWLGFTISLHLRNRVHAMITAIIALMTWAILPLIVFDVIASTTGTNRSEVWSYFGLLSFLHGLRVNAFESNRVDWLALAAINLIWHGAIWRALRAYCLNNADRLLGRIG